MISSSPTAEELATYATWLTQAEAAAFKLASGASTVSVSYNGEQVTYKPASLPQLRAVIADLRRALGKPAARNQGVAFKPVVFGRDRTSGGGGLY